LRVCGLGIGRFRTVDPEIVDLAQVGWLSVDSERPQLRAKLLRGSSPDRAPVRGELTLKMDPLVEQTGHALSPRPKRSADAVQARGCTRRHGRTELEARERMGGTQPGFRLRGELVSHREQGLLKLRRAGWSSCQCLDQRCPALHTCPKSAHGRIVRGLFM